METLMENGRMDDDATTRLVSRLDWWNQINRYLDMFMKNTDESINSVATGIESLKDYHQLHRSEMEEDFVDAIFTRALKDAAISHICAKLLKRMRSKDRKGWTENIRLLFQLSVEELCAVCIKSNTVIKLASVVKIPTPFIRIPAILIRIIAR
jgi:hypothetical protein